MKAEIDITTLRTPRRPQLELGARLMTAEEGKTNGVPGAPETVEALLAEIRGGDDRARAALFEHLHSDLRRMAQGHMAGQPPHHSLHPTALVHEAFLRLAQRKNDWENRGHFLGVASRAMRHILVDHARGKQAAKRQGKRVDNPLDQLVDTYESRAGDLPALDDALNRLREQKPQMAEAVDLHFFGGIPLGEVPDLLDMAPRTFERHWALAKLWLQKELS